MVVQRYLIFTKMAWDSKIVLADLIGRPAQRIIDEVMDGMNNDHGSL